MATANAATNYLERRILHYIFKNNSLSFSSPGDSLYVGLATAVSTAETGSVTEANFTNYARQQVTASNWTTIGSDSTDTQTAKNGANIEFPASGGGGDDMGFITTESGESVVLEDSSQDNPTGASNFILFETGSQDADGVLKIRVNGEDKYIQLYNLVS